MSIRIIITFLLISALLIGADSAQAWNVAGRRGVVMAASSLAPIENPKSKIQNSDDGIVHSRRLATGVPLGGIGCGTFQLLTDGTVSRATINNNRDRPTGDLKGCFAALWTNAGGRIMARALTLKSGYNLPAIAALDYDGLFPQAFLSYPDPALPVALSLRAYSPLIPRDLKNSSLPVALFVFTLKNESRAPVQASIALSWENFLGVGGTTAKGAFADRTGNTVAPVPPVSSSSGVFGLLLASPEVPPTVPDRLRYNARGSYALLVHANVPDAQVSTAGWNALDSAPGWWAQFARDGTVAGTVGEGKEGSVHPAGVVALKVSLKDRETLEIPFAVAWHTPRYYTLSDVEYGHFYEKSFADAVEVARYALENRLGLAVLTGEWQHRLLRSTLPSWLVRRLINDASPLFSNTLLTRDSGLKGSRPGRALFGMLESLTDGRGSLGAMDRRTAAHALLAAWFPGLNVQELRQFAALRASSGAIPRLYGNADQVLGGDMEGGSTNAPDVSCGFVFQVYRHYLWTGDQQFLDEFYPAAKRGIEFVATLDRDGDGIPEGGSAYGIETPNGLFCYTATIWLAALRIGQKMAEAMADRNFAAQCTAWYDRAQKSVMAQLWNGRFLKDEGGRMKEEVKAGSPHPSSFILHPSEVCFAGQLAGQWMAEEAEARDILPAEMLNGALDSLIALNDRASLYCPPAEVNPDGTWAEDQRSWVAFAVVWQAALYTLRGRADAGLELMRKIDRTIVERAQMPWQAPLRFRADTGEPEGERATMAAPSSWFYFEALEGFSLDVPAGRMCLAPNLPRDIKTLSAPVFAPTFWGWMEYRPGLSHTTLTFRLDRLLPLTARIYEEQTEAKPDSLDTGAGLLLKQVVLPSAAGTAQVLASLDRAPAPGKVSRDRKGRFVFTFDAPVRLTTGQRLEFTLR